MSEGLCQVDGCKNPSTKITATETAYKEVCDDCFYRKYKK